MDYALIVAGLVAAAAALWLRGNLEAVTIFEYERGLKYARGRFDGVLSPARYWFFRPTTVIRRIDIRPTLVPVSSQEVLSSDGVAVKVSLAATFQITDPAQAINGVQDFRESLYAELQLALRGVISGAPIDELLAARATVGERVREIATERVRRHGLELIEVDLKDLTLPGELKKIFSQVVRARQEGLAALEKARGETAALRSLANAAQLVERSPHLMQLRLLQVLGQQSGNTVVLGVPQSTGPIPVRAINAASESPEAPEA